MVSYKLDKYDKYFVAFILVILVIFNIGSCFAVEGEETIQPQIIDNCVMSANNTIIELANHKTYFIELEKGYSYRIELTMNPTGDIYDDIRTGFSNSTSIGSTVYNYTVTSQNYTTVINSNDYDYFYFCFGEVMPEYNITYNIVKFPNASMTGTVGSLVENVGPQQLWSVFESGIDFVGVVVLVAFGLFLIVLLVKKLSKGKSDF